MSDLQYLPRALTPALQGALSAFPVVVVVGARQVGKTTLVRHVAPGRRYQTLDDLDVRELAEREPETLVEGDEPITLDEVQRVPPLLLAVKRAVDRERVPGRFLLTGSADLLLMRAVSETLAGRAVYLRLGTMTAAERAGLGTAGRWTEIVTAESADALQASFEAKGPPWSWAEAAWTGGYPPTLGLSPEDRSRWYDGYVATYLERDLQQIAGISALGEFRRLMRLSATRVGTLLNRADLARDLGVPRPTVSRWLDLLVVSFYARLLEPRTTSRGKRVVKAPKLYFGDTGLAAHLAGIADAVELEAEPRAGAWLENLVLGDLDTWTECVVPRPEVMHWRTSDGYEVDFTVHWRRRTIPVEVKASRRARADDTRGLAAFLSRHRSAPYGVVLHTGEHVARLGQRIVALPLPAVLGLQD